MIRDRRAILALLTGLNFLTYLDRLVIAAVVRPMSAELGLSNTKAGLLASAFLIGYFATSPLFGARADKAARKGLIAFGVAVWSLATVASGLSDGFWSLFIARTLVGVGEASFAALAPTIIDDMTPPDRKARALAIFYLATPIGAAAGYLVGGALASQWGWRAAFFVAGGPGVVLALACLAIAEPSRKLAHAKARLIDGLREITRVPLFRRGVLGYSAYTWGVGGFSYWAPKFLVERFEGQLNDAKANFWFGLVLVAGGAIGTYIGGQRADRGLRGLPLAGSEAPYDAPEHKAVVNVQLRTCAIGMMIAAPLAALAFLSPWPAGFFVMAFGAIIGLFMSTSPVSAACMRAVPPERRASAMAGQIFAIHLLGDLWSVAAIGQLLDRVENVIAMMSLPLVFAWAAYIWWPRKHEATGPSSARPSSAVE